MTCPPWPNTAHIPQQTYIKVGDETYINLDYSKIKGAGKLYTRVIMLITRIYSWKMAHTQQELEN